MSILFLLELRFIFFLFLFLFMLRLTVTFSNSVYIPIIDHIILTNYVYFLTLSIVQLTLTTLLLQRSHILTIHFVAFIQPQVTLFVSINNVFDRMTITIAIFDWIAVLDRVAVIICILDRVAVIICILDRTAIIVDIFDRTAIIYNIDSTLNMTILLARLTFIEPLLTTTFNLTSFLLDLLSFLDFRYIMLINPFFQYLFPLLFIFIVLLKSIDLRLNLLLLLLAIQMQRLPQLIDLTGWQQRQTRILILEWILITSTHKGRLQWLDLLYFLVLVF